MTELLLLLFLTTCVYIALLHFIEYVYEDNSKKRKINITLYTIVAYAHGNKVVSYIFFVGVILIYSLLDTPLLRNVFPDDKAYPTRPLSYWTAMKENNAAKLSRDERIILKRELKNARQNARRMKQEIICLEEKAALTQRDLAQQDSTGAEVAMNDYTRRSLMALEELREKRRDLERQSYQIAAMETFIQNDEARKKGEPVGTGVW